MNWINAKDRLPNLYETVLVYCENKNYYFGCRNTHNKGELNKHWLFQPYNHNWKVIYWTTLEPPKEEL